MVLNLEISFDFNLKTQVTYITSVLTIKILFGTYSLIKKRLFIGLLETIVDTRKGYL